MERQPRPIEIYKLELVRWDLPSFCLDIECSKGTYIRTLLEDVAASLGTCACMTSLLRTRAGQFRIEDSHTLDEIAEQQQAVLLPTETVLTEFPKLEVNELQAFRITSGVRTTIKGAVPGQYRLCYLNNFLGVVTVEDEIVKPEKIIFPVARPPESSEQL